ncbi:MAG: sialate O-acetylesterase [Phycisphaerae bacterium]|nr:sialate O-acetylesterase [Phycisphaerae bacterium]
MTLRRGTIVAALCLLTLVATAAGELKLPSIISNNMVIQVDREVPIWGRADPGQSVSVSMDGSLNQVEGGTVNAAVMSVGATTTADKDGKWMVKLGKIKPAGMLCKMTIKAGDVNKVIDNILVGEVWVCSGQSNMQWNVRGSNNADEEIQAAKFPKIRLFTVTRKATPEKQADCGGKWVLCSPETIAGFSAVGYFFGRDLHKTLKVPVGLINTSWGGTRVEAWTDPAVVKACPKAKELTAWWDDKIKGFSQDKFDGMLKKQLDAHKAAIKAETKRVAEARKASKTLKRRRIRRPRGPLNPITTQHLPVNLYNGMIAPLVPYAIRGAIWYQGESNASRAYQYRTLFPLMIKNWRKAWGQGDFPFLWVQLANFRKRNTTPVDDDWAELREAQSMTLALPNTGQAVTIDIGDGGNIHPKNKQDVGKRLALEARRVAYDQDVVHSGPKFSRMSVDGKYARLTFRNIGGGLIAKGAEGKLVGFAIAGADKKFVWADAIFPATTPKDYVHYEIYVSSPLVPKPVAVRYAWSANPECNLFNKEGLPASPFRTDDWPEITKEAKKPGK